VTLARGLALAGVIGAAAVDGPRGVAAAAPVAAALIGGGLTRLAALADR